MAGIEHSLISLLYLLAIAAAVGVLAARYARLQYTTGLLVAGLLISAVGSPVAVELGSEAILLVLLPTLVFNDAVTIDRAAFRENLVPILVLAVVGLLISVALVAVVSQVVFGFSLAVAVLFGAMVTPTDPVSVLAIFDDLGVPDRLSTLVEGESLLNDGVAIVVYSTVLAVIVEAPTETEPLRDQMALANFFFDVGSGIVVAIVGGALAGAVVGYLALELVAFADDRLTAIVISVLAAYGVYVALDLLGASGVIGTLTAGIFLAGREDRPDLTSETRFSIEYTWALGAFVANTIIFVAIGVITPLDLLLTYADQILVAVGLVFLARVLVVYPLLQVLDRWETVRYPRSYQHVIAWSGIHASVSIALVLDATEVFSGPLPDQLAALVFGVAAFTLLVNGTTMGRLVDRLGLTTESTHRQLYDALVGRLQGVDAALDHAEKLLERDEIPESVYDDVTEAYRAERTELESAIERVFDRYPDLRKHEQRVGERRVLVAEYDAIHGAMQRGEVSTEVGERLLADVEAKLDRLETPDWSLDRPTPPGYTQYWRERLAEVDLETDGPRSGDDDTDR
ncbi:cation:proton antiporter [Halobacteriales archaeon Cl-PHB]